MARSMARRVALRMLIASISLAEAHPTPTAIAHDVMSRNNASRTGAVNFFESSTPESSA